MKSLIEIQFPSSKSKTYSNVLKSARLFSGFREGDPNILKIGTIRELFGRWDDFSVIIFNATKWAGTNVLYLGRPVLPYKNDFFYRLLNVRLCFQEYQERADKPGFCFQRGWGCNRLESVARWVTSDFFGKPFWYEYGYFQSDGIWIVDKEKILSVLLEEARVKMIDQCPAFNPDNIRAVVDSLPGIIYTDNENWEVVYKTDFRENGPVRVPVGILHVDSDNSPVLPPDELSSNRTNEINDLEANRLIDAWKKDQKKGPSWKDEPF